MHRLGPVEDVPDPLAPYLSVDRGSPRHECWVTGHMVAGLDGTPSVGGRVADLSTAPDQALFRRLREIADVVLVGATTVRREGYGPVVLSADARGRRAAAGRSPAPPLAIVSGSLELDWSARAFAGSPDDQRPIILTSDAAEPARRAEAERHATVLVAGDERVQPAAALHALAELGHRVVVCEGGPTWLGELVAADRLDELCLTISPMIGGDPMPICVNPPGAVPSWFSLRGTLVEDDTLFLRYERRPADG